MYLFIVVTLMLLCPVGSVAIEHGLHPATPIALLIGKWFVFWSVGMRLALAGVRQFFQPKFTAQVIFDLKTDEALPLVRELGVSNFAVGVVGIASLAAPSFVLPIAITAAIFYGIAGVRHVMAAHRNTNENIAMVSDLFAFVVLAGYAVAGNAKVFGL